MHMVRLTMALVVAAVLSIAASGCNSSEKTVKTEVVEGIVMVSLPAGSFEMGYDYRKSGSASDRVAKYYPDEQPVHTVTLSAFQIGATEITQGQYEKVMGENPSFRAGDDNLPVTDVGATGALVFCNRLSEAAGLEPCYDPETGMCDFSKNGFRLPTEAEWEYACRAGTTTHFGSGDTSTDLDRTGWYLGNSGGTPHPVGMKEPNAWGLYDMHGNVWECCYDGYDETYPSGNYPDEPVTDPTGYDTFNHRIIRGGAWNSRAAECRSAVRGAFWTGGGSDFLGFRVARSVR